MQKQHIEFRALAFSAPRLVVQYPIFAYLYFFFSFPFFHGKRVKMIKKIATRGSTRKFKTKPFIDDEAKQKSRFTRYSN